MAPDRTRTIIIAAGWLVALGAALLLDGAVATAVAPIAPAVKHSAITPIVKFPGWFPCTLLIALALTLGPPWGWRGGGLLCVTGLLGGLMYWLAKWFAGRVRPIVRIEPYAF